MGRVSRGPAGELAALGSRLVFGHRRHLVVVSLGEACQAS